MPNRTPSEGLPQPPHRRGPAALALLALVLCLAALGAPGGAFAAEPTATLKGTLSEAGTGAQGVSVQMLLEEKGAFTLLGSTTTNAEGKYEEKVPPGSYKLKFTPPAGPYAFQFNGGVASLAQANAVEVKAPGATEVSAALKLAGTVSGSVTDASTHQPLSGITVAARSAGEPQAPTAIATSATSTSGEYELGGLPPGTYVLQISGSGYLTEKLGEVPVAEAAATQQSAALTPARPLSTSPPVASGSGSPGETLSCSQGLWSGEEGITYTYRWLREATPISAAVEPTYVVLEADRSHSLSCEVTASDKAGSAHASSNAISVPGATPNSPSTPGTTNTATNTATNTPPATIPVTPLHTTLLIPSARATIAVSTVSILAAGRKARVLVSCLRARCAGRVELLVALLVRVREGQRTRRRAVTLVLAKGSFALAPGRRATVVLSLTRTGVGMLASALGHQVPVLLSSSLAGGESFTKPVLFGRARKP